MPYPLPYKETEEELQQKVINLAELTGHLVYHTYDSRKSQKGFPDLVIVKPEMARPIFAELKSEKGQLRPDQATWKLVLEAMKGVDYRLWRPSSWPEIEETLTGRKR